ncbi:MAG TPA: hypothetical protein VGU27_08365, partial [Candidatus Eisenbacteria bacterium]|nr:hypothetical protein [Candidatus Eisenbacteria bacterium]
MSERLARALVAGMALVAIAAFAGLALQRLPAPTELGAGEGLLLDHAIRFAAGKPVYGPPSFEFIPLAYMPGMPLLAAPLVRLFGAHLWEGRLIDLVALAILGAVFVAAMKRETGSVVPGLAATGLFLMGQGFTKGGYDVFRPDPVMLLLSFAGAATLRFTTTARGALLAALLFSLGFVVKQHAAVFAAAMLPALWFTDRRRLAPYLGGLLVFGVGGFALLRLWLGPWFTFYVYDVPSHWSQLSRARILHYLTAEAFGRFAMLTAPAVLALPSRPWREPVGIWWWMALGGAGTGFLATLDPYAYYHTLMPSLCGFALLGPLALHRLGADQRPEARPALAWATALLLAVQFATLAYSPRALRPHPHGARTLARMVAFLRAQPRPTLVLHGFYMDAAGRGTALDILPLDDVLRARGNHLLRRDPAYFERLFASVRSGPGRPAFVTDTTLESVGDASRPLWRSIAPGYRLAGDLGDLARELQPLAGEH